MPIFRILTSFLARFFTFPYKLSNAKKKVQQPTTFGDFVFLFDYLNEKSREECMKTLNNAEKPKYLFGKHVPEDFKNITFGQYSDLCDYISKKDDVIVTMRNIIKTIYNVTNEDIDKENAYDIWGFVTFAIKEADNINKLFSSIRIEYTDQEKKAGINLLQFGTFGILDWYSKRMGIVDQNLVQKEKWVRLYQCMKNDTEETAFNRRLQKVYEDEAKTKSRR